MSKSTLLMLIMATYSNRSILAIMLTSLMLIMTTYSNRSDHAHLVDVDLPEEVHPDQLPHEAEHQVALLLLRSVQDLK